MENHDLFWKRSGLTAVVILGAGAGILYWCLASWAGWEQGVARAVQTSETGQAMVLSRGRSLDEYFTLDALIKDLPGVAALSARSRFSTEVFTSDGTFLPVNICAVSFSDERQVTDLLSRLDLKDPETPPALVVPRSWNDMNLYPLDQVLEMDSLGPNGKRWTVPVSGTYTPSFGKDLKSTVYMGLNLARRVFGTESSITEIAIRLKDGIDPDRWVGEHRADFKNMDLSLVTWKDGDKESYSVFLSKSPGIYWFLGMIAVLVTGTLLTYGWKSRSPRSSFSLAFLGGVRSRLLKVLVLSLSFLGALAVFKLALPGYESLLLFGMVDPEALAQSHISLWGWDWYVLVVPVVVLVLTVLGNRLKIRFPNRMV